PAAIFEELAARAAAELADIAACDVILMATPAQHTRAVAHRLARLLAPATPVVLCAKGIEQSTHDLMSTVLAQTIPDAVPLVLSGPSFADEVAQSLPAALTLACTDHELGAALAGRLGHPGLRLYWTDDLTGAQIGGAIKNVLAIAAGIVVGKQLGANAHAALVTRGFAEMIRFGSALGARPETLTGLCGLGDLMLTCSSRQSRNMSLGIALGRGEPLAAILGARRSVSEGVYTAGAVAGIASQYKLDLPICSAIQAIVSGAAGVDEAIQPMLARQLRAEHGEPASV
ncbi:MAG: NAD(P)H-dependent glycerol-3-phosphate dehydrogenase, partial [Hyphomicrobiales bacterium]